MTIIVSHMSHNCLSNAYLITMVVIVDNNPISLIIYDDDTINQL